MIVYPSNWYNIGEKVDVSSIERIIENIINDMRCEALSLSGGIDSALLLYFMSKSRHKVRAYTIGYSENHPDVVYARKACEWFDNVEHIVHIPTSKVERLEGDLPGDEFVREFYRFVSNFEDGMITGDGVDELMCGYYGHQSDPTDETYFKYIRNLLPSHLEPLHKNSGGVFVYLPYLDDRLVSVLSMIPISEKVDSETRKKIMIEIANGKLPDSIVYRRKYGFVNALSDIREERDGD